MSRHSGLRILAALLLVAGSLSPAAAKSQTGGVVDPSAILGFGARPAAMGNAYVALADDATAVYWNPAALELSRRKEIFGQYSSAFFDNTTYNMVAYKHPLGRFGTLGGGMIIEGVNDLTKRDINAGSIGTFNVSKTNAMFSYGKQVTEGFYLGTSLHILHQQIAEFAGTGFGLDVGALYRFTNRYVEYSRAYLHLAREQLRQDAERFYSLGMRSYEKGDYTGAFEQFMKAVETDPSDKGACKMLLMTGQKDRALLDRARAMCQRNGSGGAMAEFLKAHSKSGQTLENLREWFDEGVTLYDAGKIKESIPFFEAVIRRSRENFVTDRLAIGMNAQNLLQPSIKLKTTADKIPLNIKLGAAYKLTDWLQFALDVDLPSKGPMRLHFGTEWRPVDWLAVRAGLDQDAPSFGFGFKYQDLKIDYAFMPSNDLDNDFQRVGLSYEFGKSQGDIAAERIQRGLTLQSKKDYSAANQEWESAQKLQPANPLPRRYIQENEESYKRNVTTPMADAERHLSAGQLMEAKPILTAILAFDPDNEPAKKSMEALNAAIPGYIAAHFNAGYLKFLQGDDASVQGEMNRVLYFQPGHTAAEKYRDAARQRQDEEARRATFRDQYTDAVEQYRAGRWPEAQARFQSLLRRDPTHPTAGEMLGQIAQFQAADFSPEEMKNESDRFFRLAQAEYLDDNVLKSEVLVSHSLALDPNNEDAKNLLSRLVAAHNKELLDALQLGDEHMSRGNAEAAIAAWRKVLEKDPGNFDAQKRLESAADAIRNFVETMIRTAQRMENSGQIIDALKSYNRALAVDPFNEAARSRRAELRPQVLAQLESLYKEADALYQRGELEKSIHTLSNLVSIDPELTQARDLQDLAKSRFDQSVAVARARRLFTEADEFFRNKNFEQAISTWQEIVTEATPSQTEVAQLAKEAEARIAEAVHEAERERAQSFVDEFLRTGDAYLAEGRDVEALDAFRQARELQPDNSSIQWRISSAEKLVRDRIANWIRKGSDALSSGRLDIAGEFFQSVLGVEAENAEALDGLHRIRAIKEEMAAQTAAPAEGAMAEAKPAEPLTPTLSQVEREPTGKAEQITRLVSRAEELRQKVAGAMKQNRIDLAIGRMKGALDLYRSVLKLDPGHASARQATTELGADISRLQKMLKEKNTADLQKYLYSGMGHYRAGRLNEAIADWNRILSIDPGHAQAREYIKRAEKKLDLLKTENE